MIREIVKRRIETNIPQLNKFPSKYGTGTRIKFIKENYRGLEFAKNVFEKEYESEGRRYEMSYMENDKRTKKDVLNQYKNFFKQEEFQFDFKKTNNIGYYQIHDPFEGTWYLIALENGIYGLYGNVKEGDIKKLLEKPKKAMQQPK